MNKKLTFLEALSEYVNWNGDFIDGEYVLWEDIEKVVSKFDEKNRSPQLNKAFHKWLSMISEEANEKGLTLDLLFTKPQEMRITPDLLKDLFREYGVYMYHKDSTAKLTNKEFTKLIEVFEQVIAERLDCTIPFPSHERE